MWPWKHRVSPTEALVSEIIKEGLERRKIDSEILARQREFDLKKLEIEMEHLTETAEERRKDRAANAAAREARQRAAAHMREVNAAKRNPPQDDGACRVCRDPGNPGLTAREIEWHHNGHREGPSIWSN